MDILISLDFFGSYLHWYVNHQKKVYTQLGGVLTIISFSICIMILAFQFTELLNRDNPQTTENDIINNEFKKISFYNEKIYIPWAIRDYNNHKVNFTGLIYPIVYYSYREKDIKTGNMPYNYTILNYTLCNETNLKNTNYFQDNFLGEFYCIEWNNLLMGGSYASDFIYHIRIDFFLCEDGVNFGTEGKKCADFDELAKYIGDKNVWHIAIYYPEIQFNPRNKNNPMEIFYDIHFYNLNKLNTKVERFYLKEFVLIDDQGWVFEHKKNLTFWGFDKFESDSYTRSVDGNDIIKNFSTSKIYSLVIYLNRNSKIFTRKYTKLLDALGNILSIVNGVFILFKLLSQFFTEAYQDKNIVSNIFVQKYFMNEKYNEYNKTIRLNESFNHEKTIHQNSNQRLSSNNDKNNINNINIKPTKTIAAHKKPIMKIDTIIPDIPLENQESKGNTIQINKNENLISIKNISKFIKIKEKSEHILNKIQRNQIGNASLDNSKIKIGLKRYRSNFGLNIKHFQLEQIKDYMEKDLNQRGSQPLNNYGSKDFNFPYYLYLLNIFNKTFGVTRMCCVGSQFKYAWKYVIEVFDVVKFIELQTNVDLINKILFELKIEKRLYTKESNISQENKESNIFNNNINLQV